MHPHPSSITFDRCYPKQQNEITGLRKRNDNVLLPIANNKQQTMGKKAALKFLRGYGLCTIRRVRSEGMRVSLRLSFP